MLFDNRLFDNQLDIYESLYMPDQKSWNSNVNNVRFNVIIPVGWVGSFCFNLLLPFLSILCILSFQAISFQILLYALFRRFPWLTLLLFPSYFKLHNLTYVRVMSWWIIWPYHHKLIWIIISLIFIIIPTIYRSTSVDTLSASLTPHIIRIMRRSTPSNLVSSATVSPHVS